MRISVGDKTLYFDINDILFCGIFNIIEDGSVAIIIGTDYKKFYVENSDTNATREDFNEQFQEIMRQLNLHSDRNVECHECRNSKSKFYSHPGCIKMIESDTSDPDDSDLTLYSSDDEYILPIQKEDLEDHDSLIAYLTRKEE